MKKKIYAVLSSLVLVSSFTMVTQYAVAQESDTTAEESQKKLSGVTIEGLGDHYHTGDEIKLVAALADEDESNYIWQWLIRENAESEWQIIEGLTTNIFSREATTDGLQVKVEVLDENNEQVDESATLEITIDDHHSGSPNAERIYSGFFYNDEVEDRELSDWVGDWKSVYPSLLSGTLDKVFEAKAAESDSMSAEEYKEYYTMGYETDVDRVVIEGNSFAFYYADGTEVQGTYEYDGYEILTYDRGNRGVRFIFKRTEEVAEMPQYIQFSDHSISPTDAAHFHLYWGDDRSELLDEVVNWPTYYPSDLDDEGLVNDMLAH